MSESEAITNKLMKSLSRLVSEFKLPIPGLKAKISMNLFSSSKLWSDQLLIELKKELAAYITSMLDQTSSVKSDGCTYSVEILLSFKHYVEENGFDA